MVQCATECCLSAKLKGSIIKYQFSVSLLYNIQIATGDSWTLNDGFEKSNVISNGSRLAF